MRVLAIGVCVALIASCSSATLPSQIESAVPSFSQFIQELTPESAEDDLARLVGGVTKSEQRSRIAGQLVTLMEIVGPPDQVDYIGAYVLGEDPGVVELRFVSFHRETPVAWKFRLYLVGSQLKVMAVEFDTDDLPGQYGQWVPA